MIDVHDLVVEPLQSSFWDHDQTNRNFKIGKHDSRFCQVRKMVEIFLNIVTPSRTPECGYQTNRSIRCNHGASLLTSLWSFRSLAARPKADREMAAIGDGPSAGSIRARTNYHGRVSPCRRNLRSRSGSFVVSSSPQ